MGLDWHARVKNEEHEDISGNADLNTKALAGPPCICVKAPQMKDLDDFRERMFAYLDAKRQQMIREQRVVNKYRNQEFIKLWQNMTLEQVMASEGSKFCCEVCPLIKALQGADSQASCFLGITVSTCDFRGKRIGADDALGDLAEEAFTEHCPDQMLDYADRLEKRLGILHKSILEKNLTPSMSANSGRIFLLKPCARQC